MQISNRANGQYPHDELNKRLQLTFSDDYTTEVNVLVQSLSQIQGLGDIPNSIIHSDQSSRVVYSTSRSGQHGKHNRKHSSNLHQ